MAETARNLVVLGTINRDYTVFVERHPSPGETVLGRDFGAHIGGKGANQAAAAARAGAQPKLVSAVGDDDAGRALVEELTRRGVDTGPVATKARVASGMALIVVDAAGENTIVVAAGASAALDGGEVAAGVAELAGPHGVLLTQLELDLPVVEAACLAAAEAGARIVLNLSPAREVSAELFAVCDPLIVNAGEAETLSGLPAAGHEQAEAVAAALAAKCRSCVVTLGADGAAWAADGEVGFLAAPQVPVIDTTGAGDAFAGALAAALAAGHELPRAVADGVAAGAAAVQHVGAQAD